MTRLQRAQAALRALLLELDDVNVGLLHFSSAGEPTLLPVDYLDAADGGAGSQRQRLLTRVAELQPVAAGSLRDLLYAAALYYAGRDAGSNDAGFNDAGFNNIGSNNAGSNDAGFNNIGSNNAGSNNVGSNDAGSNNAGSSDAGSNDASSNDASSSAAGQNNAASPAPIRGVCQGGHHIVLLTDGEGDLSSPHAGIASLIDAPCAAPAAGERCVADLARHLSGRDQSTLPGSQRVTTHVLDLGPGGGWLEGVATAGGGQYRRAAGGMGLAFVLGLQTANLLVAPVATVNQFPRLDHQGEVYFAMYRPQRSRGWPGNLKKYRLGLVADGAVDGGAVNDGAAYDGAVNDGGANDGSTVSIRLLDGASPPRAALDPDTGLFADNARSLWSATADGASVARGGAESHLPRWDMRRVYTWGEQSQSMLLSHSANQVSVGNSALTAAVLGVDVGVGVDVGMDAAARSQLIEWIRGRDVDDEDADNTTQENRHIIGDPLHSRPVAVRYGPADVTVFFGTNAGFLHGVDAATGREHFAFIPQDLLERQRQLRAATEGRRHIYGLDGSAAVRVGDVDGDGMVEPGDGDFVHLYIGQRRGGRSYHALDVTDRNNPRVLWRIVGGGGRFVNLGQTWATPVPGRINIGGVVRQVLYLSGGYDPGQDRAATRRADSMGNALYIVDAATGALLWSGGANIDHNPDPDSDLDPGPGSAPDLAPNLDSGSDSAPDPDSNSDSDLDPDDNPAPNPGHTRHFNAMRYALPATPAVADADGDGLDDVIFIGDMGGQLWRFDIHQGAAAAGVVTGGVVADLGGEGAADNRRFYHAPDVALVRRGRLVQYAVGIGSGYRAHPLNTATRDRFYLLTLPRAAAANGAYTRHTEANLYDASANEIGEGRITAELALAGRAGWYIRLPHLGEKVLGTPLTFGGTLAFTTYQPQGGAEQCAPLPGLSRVYQVRLRDASPVRRQGGDDGGDDGGNLDNISDNNALTEADRSRILPQGSIITEPVRVCVGDNCAVLVGTESLPGVLPARGRMVKSFWRRQR